MGTEQELQDLFEEERADTTRIAMLGRLLIILLFALWFGISRNPPIVYYTLAGCALIAGVTALHLRLIPAYQTHRWLPYFFYALDVGFVLAGIAVAMSTIFDGLPRGLLYHFNYFPLLFLVLISTGLSLSPRIVLWTGLCLVLGWGALFLWADHPGSLDWNDIPAGATDTVYMSFLLSPDWTASNSRIQESIVLLAVAGMLALIVFRTQRLVRRQIQAERRNRTIRETFGQYVPDAIAEAVLASGGILPTQERVATVVFCDLAGFTNLTDRLGPEATVRVLNAYFDTAAACIGERGGVITQFQGDAVLAVFNAPTDLENHAQHALAAALALLQCCREQAFEGEQLSVRVGLATGPLVAGTVGGAGRRGYTVHGNTVNLAARLEALNKTTGTTILMDSATASALPADTQLRRIENAAIAGLDGRITLFTPQDN